MDFTRAKHGAVVAAFIGPDNVTWQGEPVMVTEDGTWWTWSYAEDKWIVALKGLEVRNA